GIGVNRHQSIESRVSITQMAVDDSCLKEIIIKPSRKPVTARKADEGKVVIRPVFGLPSRDPHSLIGASTVTPHIRYRSGLRKEVWNSIIGNESPPEWGFLGPDITIRQFSDKCIELPPAHGQNIFARHHPLLASRLYHRQAQL